MNNLRTSYRRLLPLLMLLSSPASAANVGNSVANLFDTEVPRIERALRRQLFTEAGAPAASGQALDAMTLSTFSLSLSGIVGVEVPEFAEIKVFPSLTLTWVKKNTGADR